MAKPLSKTVVVAYGRSAVAKSGKKGALCTPSTWAGWCSRA